ncbi:MAG: type IX secretion system sortase PorU [bacterium]
MSSSFFRFHFSAVLFLTIFTVAACPDLSSASESDLKLYQSTTQQTVVDFNLSGFKFDTLRTHPTIERLVPIIENGLSLAEKGAPNLPMRSFILGVPVGARIEATVLPLRFEELHNIEIAPLPDFQRSQDSNIDIYKADEKIFGRNVFYPQSQVTVDTPSRFRQQTTVRVQFSPFQYNPVTKVLRILQEARIVVHHSGGVVATAVPPVNSEFEESFYRSLILNYAQARTFRAPAVSGPAPSGRFGKTNSPFADVPLYKFPITKEGIYRITGQTLSAKALASIASAEIRIYNNGGRELPRLLSARRPEGLVENAIYVSDGGDGRLDANDFILFYGRGIDGFAFDSTSGSSKHYLNHFGFNNYYWISIDPIVGAAPASRMNLKTTLPTAGLTAATSYQDKLFVEEEANVWLESDQTWFGHLFTNASNTNTRRYRVQLTDPVTEVTDSLRVQLFAPYYGVFGSAAHRLSVAFNGQDLGEFSYFGDSQQTQSRDIPLRGISRNGENEIQMTYSGQGDVARLYMDYFELKYERHLRMPSGGLLPFDGRRGATPVAYRLDNVNPQDIWLFDVSDFTNVARLRPDNWQISGAQVVFADETHPRVPRRYLAATSATFADIEAAKIENDSPSNLRSSQNAADMIVITHDDFISQAQRLESLRENWHTGGSNQQMAVEVVNIQDVFDEFSCGLYDPVAIRDFLRYAYLNWQTRPTYVVLFGDGDYDPKNILIKTDKNWIPTFHSVDYNPIAEQYRVTDSWFTYLVGVDDDRSMDMAIGRLPVRSLTEAQAYMDKLIKYETAPDFGPWRNTVIMVADDENYTGGAPSGAETVHITDTEELVSVTPKYFDIKKVYLTEYASVQSASISGILKPAANETILRMINAGALMVNYTGHGNPNVWTHERVLELSTDLDRIQNGSRQALWVAATCTFGKFDMPERQSFAEQLLLLPQKGAIAVFATTRDVYSNWNAALNQALYLTLFRSGQIPTPLGLAHVQARAQTANLNYINDEKFHLYGDPSLRLAVPRYSTDLSAPDTLKALAITTVRGTVKRDGLIVTNFNGNVRLEAFDTQRRVDYRNAGITINYDLPGNSIFRGEAPVVNGRFEVRFVAPKDITYGGRRGRMTAYFWNDSTDGNGFRENLQIRSATTNVVDKEGPEIKIGFAGVNDFASGGYVGLHPVLEVTIHDTLSGINLAGEIGHNITLELDGNAGDKIDVTDLFSYNSGSYTRGSLRYVLENISEGRHTLEAKAWDNFNNSNTISTEFVVVAQDELRLFNVMNYPNPLRNNTSFTFELNQANADVEIKIYTLAGRLIRKLEAEPTAVLAGFNMVSWDGMDADGDRPANGVYLYKISARRSSADNGETLQAEEIGKLVIQR